MSEWAPPVDPVFYTVEPCPSPDCDANPRDEEEAPTYEHIDALGHHMVRLVCGCGVAGPWASTFDEADAAWNDLPRTEGQDD